MKNEYVKEDKKLPSDEQLIERILNGEKQIYEKLIRKYNDRFYRIGMFIVNSPGRIKNFKQKNILLVYFL